MRYFVPIDRSTIKQNKNAGQTSYEIPAGPDEYTFTVEDENGKKLIYQKYSNSCWQLTHSEFSTIPEKIKKINFETKINTQTVHTLSPAPKYSYKYHDIDVRCFYCLYMFNINKLETDSNTEYYNDKVCPSCGTWDCCELEYEEFCEEMVK